MLFADVIPDISVKALDRPFQYKVSDELKDKISIGSLVKIPFGNSNRQMEGYVINLTEEPNFDISKMKYISGTVENSITPMSRFFKLAVWLKHTTGSNLNDAIKAVMPVKMQIKEKNRTYLKIIVGGEELKAALETAEKRKYVKQVEFLKILIDIYEKKSGEGNPFVLDDGYIDFDALRKRYLLESAVLKSLEKKGLIKIYQNVIFRNPYDGLSESLPNENKIELNDEQKNVCDKITELYKSIDIKNPSTLKPCLIHGITGSGKTLCYINIIKEVVKSGKQVIVLIPEIALTFQTIKRFTAAFGDRCACMHSRLSHGERYDQYKRAKEGLIDIMIGPRSALFTPFQNLGMIVMDEEHESSYQNEYSPKYHARKVAEYIAREEGALFVLGSATPSIEAAYKAQIGEYHYFTLRERAVNGAVLPTIWITDLREELKRHNRSIFGAKLHELILDRLQKKEQVMLFINRRGYSGFVSCRECGEAILCPNCSVSLKAHSDGRGNKILKCHYCGYETAFPKTCPKCNSKYIGTFGTGTQKVEKMVNETFPGARVLRMDRDTTSVKNGHDKIIEKFSKGEADILVGTQMIVKGHDFPNCTLVGILAADMSLNVNDYKAAEQTYELLVQASGRAGRGDKPGDVVIQTYQPDSPVIRCAASNNYRDYYTSEIKRRKNLQYPPVSHILEILMLSPKEEELKSFSDTVSEYLKRKSILALGPVEADVYKINNIFRMLIYIKGEKEEKLERIRDGIQDFSKNYLKENSIKNMVIQYKIT